MGASIPTEITDWRLGIKGKPPRRPGVFGPRRSSSLPDNCSNIAQFGGFQKGTQHQNTASVFKIPKREITASPSCPGRWLPDLLFESPGPAANALLGSPSHQSPDRSTSPLFEPRLPCQGIFGHSLLRIHGATLCPTSWVEVAFVFPPNNPAILRIESRFSGINSSSLTEMPYFSSMKATTPKPRWNR